MIYFLICIVISIWTLYVLKDIRDVGADECPVIPLWFAILYVLVGMVPIFNILFYIAIIVFIIANHSDIELQENNIASKCTKKVINLFNIPI